MSLGKVTTPFRGLVTLPILLILLALLFWPKKMTPPPAPATPVLELAVLFYRISEIRARARLVNETIQPDLVLCLHYNGTASKVPIPGQSPHPRTTFSHPSQRHLRPVIFMEPYVMNSTEFVARFQADPEAIGREYAQAVAEGIISYYAGKS